MSADPVPKAQPGAQSGSRPLLNDLFFLLKGLFFSAKEIVLCQNQAVSGLLISNRAMYERQSLHLGITRCRGLHLQGMFLEQHGFNPRGKA